MKDRLDIDYQKRKIGEHDKNWAENKISSNIISRVRDRAGLAIFSFQDQDSEKRVFPSGFDYFFAAKGKAFFFEAKKSIEKPDKNILSRLSDFQQLSAYEILSAKNIFYVPEYIIPADRPEKFDPELVQIKVHRIELKNDKLINKELFTLGIRGFVSFILTLTHIFDAAPGGKRKEK